MGVEVATNYAKMEEDISFTDSQLVYSFRLALKSVSSGDTESYSKLVDVMNPSGRLAPDEAALLLTSTKALSGAVADIDDLHHEKLLKAIFNLSLWNFGPDVIDALLELIVLLAASNGKHVDSCLDMLVSNFTPPNKVLDMLKQPRGLDKKERVLPRVHAALKNISELVPMAASRLSSIVLEQMPWKSKRNVDQWSMKRQLIYVENMFKLESGAIREFVGANMLKDVMIVLRDLDVAIGWDDILHDDSSKGVFMIELEDENYADGDEYADEDGKLPSTLSETSLSKNLTAELLDSLMVQTFEHLESSVSNKRLSEVFDTLLSSFKDTVLNTYKSKFTQFVMFYACALDPEHCGTEFASELIDMFVGGHNPLTRMSAVAYLASFLARGKFLPPAFVASYLGRLVDWCWQYCVMHDGDMNPKLHQVFYSGCQAMMYILCFRMRLMVEIPLLKSQLFCMPIDKIFKHKLDPLKVCLPSIVEEFLKQAKAARLFTSSKTFVFEDLLVSNLSRDFGGLERLDMFFPFDPCLLKNADRSFIRPNYVYWKYVRTTYHEDIDDDDEEDGSDGEVEGVTEFDDDMEEVIISRSYGDNDLEMDEFDYAMNKMSITPRNNSSAGLRMPSRIRPSMSPESL
ncbi:unnamed protein product [Linum trigynum]|uniref:RNA polymerase I-specific transcription initiation factor RRN3 n=1 Tax=Linum trigynum TaxID=586398 RepID=A0AAV2CJ66_9ROSI